MRNKLKAFTIIQLILTIALIAILAAIVFIAINPSKNFAETRNEQRMSDLKSITNGLQQYTVDNQGQFFPTIDNKLRIIGTATSGCASTCTIVTAQGEPINNFSYQATNASDFNQGTYSNTTYNNTSQMLELNAAGKTAKTGSYTSKIIDAQHSALWTQLNWSPLDKYQFALPDNKAIIDTGAAGVVNMTGNQLLLHLNNSGASVNDASGSGNTGTAINTSPTSGYFDQALQFTGNNSYITIPNSGSLNPSTALTLEAWIKWSINPATSTSWAQIINKNVDNQYQIQHSQTNNAFEFALRTSTGRRYMLSTTAPQQGIWYHVVATYDGSFMRLYVNGNLERSIAANGTIPSSTTPVNIGSRTSNDRYFTGTIDEVAIYDRALSATEISSRFNAGSTKLKFQIRACTDASCSGNSFSGPDGSISTFYNASSATSLIFSTNPISRYFQYKIIFETSNSNFTPRLGQINIASESLNVNQTTSEDSCLDLQSLVTNGQLVSIPMDPSNGTSAKTNYGIRSINGTTQVYACQSELNAIIMRSFH
jgi:type II secretory pathway pseudopilin PulG